MAYVIKKGAKFLEAHGYSTAHGYRFFWTKDVEKAKQFAEDDPTSDFFKNTTGGRIVETSKATSNADFSGERSESAAKEVRR